MNAGNNIVRAVSPPILAVLVLVVSAGFGPALLAQNAAAPSVPVAPAAAVAPAAPPDLQSCLSETGDYVTHGKTVSYVIGLTNTCDQRLKCMIDANVTGAKGTSLGHKVLTLGAKSSGAAATQTFTMRVKAAGGTVQVSRDCKVF
jgi:hypothetical protein